MDLRDKESDSLVASGKISSGSYGSTAGVKKDEQKKKTGNACMEFLKSYKFLLYTSHSLSAWADRMWQFAAGLFLIELSPGSLRLTAIYGFASGGAILLLGAILGDLVDTKNRLKFIRVILVINNVSISLSALIACLTFIYLDEVKVIWDGWMETLCHVGIVFFAVIGDIGDVGRKISLERDWIVVMCEDKYELTALSALLRRIDLVTNLLAPIVTGQLITYGSPVIGAIVIAVWNIISMFVEYGLLHVIYNRVPALALKGALQEETSEPDETTSLLNSSKSASRPDPDAEVGVKVATAKDSSLKKTLAKLLEPFITLYQGWGIYIRQSIVLAGLALSFLYMTVLGFDNITTGFAIEQGLTESVLGILRGVGALFGVAGTLVFPVLRRNCGIERTGLVTFTILSLCLTPCVVSVFVSGSMFQPDYLQNMPADVIGGNGSLLLVTEDVPNDNPYPWQVSTSVLSVWLLMGGIVVARFGLWASDLTVTQLLLETPEDNQRGVVNGVQNSLNKLMDLIKYILVIVLPWPQTFGYLIILSFSFIVMANMLFAAYSWKIRRHLFHFEEVQKDAKEKRDNAPELRYSQPFDD